MLLVQAYEYRDVHPHVTFFQAPIKAAIGQPAVHVLRPSKYEGLLIIFADIRDFHEMEQCPRQCMPRSLTKTSGYCVSHPASFLIFDDNHRDFLAHGFPLLDSRMQGRASTRTMNAIRSKDYGLLRQLPHRTPSPRMYANDIFDHWVLRARRCPNAFAVALSALSYGGFALLIDSRLSIYIILGSLWLQRDHLIMISHPIPIIPRTGYNPPINRASSRWRISIWI